MARQTFLPIRKLTEQPYSNILGFPKANKKQLQSRIKELQKLKINSICFEGATLIGKLHVLGKDMLESLFWQNKIKNKWQ